tara:strand:+ start:298 stop:459 length:162 start_codon:yes stop_codon:yes gene_type:complete
MKKKDTNVRDANEEANNICEECKEFNKGVFENLIMHGYKICDSCKISKIIFPI